MSDVVDFAARKKADKKPEDYTVKELLTTISEHAEIDKMKGAIVIVADDEEGGRMWVHNLMDLDLLWYAEMLRQKAIAD